MASIRPALPASPPLLAPTVELSSLGSDRSQLDAGEVGDDATFGPKSDRAQETHETGPFLIPVAEAETGAGRPPVDDARYTLLTRIGAGGMGEVWRARQRSLGRPVALKRLRKGAEVPAAVVAQFESEARLTGILDHPNIVTVHELGQDQVGRVFYTMKLSGGTPWHVALSAKRRRTAEGEIVELDLRDQLEILLEVCHAIAFAHSRGVIHRDIKPGNVMIGDYGEVLVVDWGLAVAIEPVEDLGGALTWTLENLPRAALVCGTPAYMSPETARADAESIGKPTDVYLLGAVLYHVLYGRPPHKGESVDDVITAAKHNAWAFPAKIPSRLRAWHSLLRPVLLRALASEPGLRFADAGEFAEALRRALRNYDSAKVATKAEEQLAALDVQDQLHPAAAYQVLANIIARLEQALESWPHNLAARRGLAQARLRLAEVALEHGDHALARVGLDNFEAMPPPPEPEPIAERLLAPPPDGTLVGAPRLSESLVSAIERSGSDPLRAATTPASLVSGSSSISPRPRPGISPAASTINAADIARLRRASVGAEGTSATLQRLPSSASMRASASVEEIEREELLEDERELARRARGVRAELFERERVATRRRRAYGIFGGLALALGLGLVVVLALSWWALGRERDRTQRERDRFSRELLEEAGRTTEAQLDGLFAPVYGALRTALIWARQGSLDTEDPRLLNDFYMPLLEGVPAATSTLRADARGYEYMLLREPDGWTTRSTRPGMAHELRTWDLDGALVDQRFKELEYDPHERPWYIGGQGLAALEREREVGLPPAVHWTEPYTFYTTGDPGISVSAPATSANGRELVLAIDVKLPDVSTFTQRLPERIDDGQVFVLDDNERVLGLPKETLGLDADRRKQLILAPMAELAEAPISRLAYLSWRRRNQTTDPFRIVDGERAYWVDFRRVDARARPKLWIGVVLPEGASVPSE